LVSKGITADPWQPERLFYQEYLQASCFEEPKVAYIEELA